MILAKLLIYLNRPSYYVNNQKPLRQNKFHNILNGSPTMSIDPLYSPDEVGIAVLSVD